MKNYENLRIRYLDLLENWVPAAMHDVVVSRERSSLCYYGDGTNGWGVQTVQKAFGALAVLAADPELNEKRIGMSRKKLSDVALGMLRYSLATHKTGDFFTTDAGNVRWGHTWISALGVERMMHGVEVLESILEESDKQAVKNMLVSESKWLLEKYPVRADPVRPNLPESNMWNGAIMLRTVLLYPDIPQADLIREKGIKFLLNAISVPSDKNSTLMFEGKPLSDWHIGANFFESYACNHHGYLNVGYMVITLSNLAMLHFTYRNMGVQAPEALYLHFEKLWQLVKMCLFNDGRLNRIGGDTRVRYCYCQDYLLPVLMLVADTLGEDCTQFENSWLDLVQKEVNYNDDGSFLSKRCEMLKDRSPLYYTRLESDRAVTLSYGALWRLRHDNFKKPYGTGSYRLDSSYEIPLVSWHDRYHGSCYVRGENRLASFTWGASEPPQGLCLPISDSSLAEWRMNLAGTITGDGNSEQVKVIEHYETMFTGGFATSGRYRCRTEGLLAEQCTGEDTALVSLAYAVLPDDATVVVMQYAHAIKRCHVRSVRGLRLNIPNDVFNDFKRKYDEKGNSLIVDDKVCITAVYGGEIELNCPPYRQIGLRGKELVDPKRGMLHCDEICITFSQTPQWYEKNETIFDICAAITVNGKTPFVQELKLDNPSLRGIHIEDFSFNEYKIIANFGYKRVVFERITLEPCSVHVIECN